MTDVNLHHSELACSVELQVFRQLENIAEVRVDIFRDLARPRRFFPVVFQRTYCHVRPALVHTFADERIDVVDQSYRSDDLARSSQNAVLRDVVHRVRASHARSRSHSRLHVRAAVLVQTLGIGPYDCPGESPWYFTVEIYKSATRERAFYPVVFRREVYRMQNARAMRAGFEQLDIVESTYESDRFARSSKRAAASAILTTIRGSFEANGEAALRRGSQTTTGLGRPALAGVLTWKHRRMAELVRTVEVRASHPRPKEAIFVVDVYRDLEGSRDFFPIVWRRDAYRLKPSFAGRVARQQVEVTEPDADPLELARPNADAVLAAVVKTLQTGRA